MPKMFHEINFEKLKGCAQHLELPLKANLHPTKDQMEGMQHTFNELDKCVKLYCEKTPGTEPVLKQFNIVKSEWPLLKQGKGDSKKVVAALSVMMHSNYVHPPVPAAPPAPPARPASGPPVKAAAAGAPARPASGPPVKH